MNWKRQKCQVMNVVMNLVRNRHRWRMHSTVTEGHSKQDLERVKKAMMKLHTNLGHLEVKEMVRVLKHGRASELAIQEARRTRCDVCAENVQPKLLCPAIPRQVLDINERLILDILSLPHWEGFKKSWCFFSSVASFV